jgi:UDP-N-acetylglucosamine 1-carboxyvinyltransferase
VIKGPSRLQSSDIVVPDLRAGFTYLIAAIIAEGKSTIQGIDHIERGYEDLEDVLRSWARRSPRCWNLP